MKKIISIVSLVSALCLSSCADWVSVSPKTEVESDLLFESEKGFKSALIGVYSRMTLGGLYGKALSYGYIEELAQRYDNYPDGWEPSSTERARIYRYGTDGKNTVKALWQELFKSIANINNLLTELDETGREIVLTDGYWELMKGEALGLRAYHYFDLLRLFGPVYSQNPELKCLPWRTSFNAAQKVLLPASKIAEYILADLKEAEVLLADDPLNYNEDIDRPFLGLRKHRMNRMAVKALMARVYLWIGDKTNAAIQAQEVIGQSGLSLARTNQEDVSLYEEAVFCLGMDDMENKVRNDWNDKSTYSNELFISMNNLKTVFESATVGVNDIRYKAGYGFIHGTNGAMCRKYLGKSQVYKEKIPLIRLSEMYYILAESLPLDECTKYINEVRNVRGISRTNNYTPGGNFTEEARINALDREYQKDFFAEGQYFYFLKRHARKTFYRCPVEEMRAYVMPVPDDEIEYGMVEKD